MKEKLLILFEQNYDIFNYLGTITEDNLDDFIQHFINDNYKRSNVKFVVNEIKKNIDGYISISITYNEYEVTYNEVTTKYEKLNDGLGFQFYTIDESEINKFKIETI